MKDILIAGFTDLRDGSRVFQQIGYLKKFYRGTAVRWTNPELGDVEYVPINFAPQSRLERIKRAVGYKFRQYEKLYWNPYKFEPLLDGFDQRNKKKKFDLILANDVDTLPFVFRIANGARILLDTHEYAPLHFADQFVWRFFFQGFNTYFCNRYIKWCDKVITVTCGAEITNQYDCGVVVENFDPPQIGKRLNRLATEEITLFKLNSHIATGELTASKNMEQLRQIIESMLEKNRGAA